MDVATEPDDIKGLLAPGETFLAQATQHWFALVRISRRPILAIGAAILGLTVGSWLSPSGEGLIEGLVSLIDTLLGLATLGLFGVGVAWLLAVAFRWSRGRCVLTDRRVIQAQGVLRRPTVGAGLEAITEVRTTETWLGRRLGFEDLVVVTAGSPPLHLGPVIDALVFKRAIMDGQEAMLRERAAQIMASSSGRPVPIRPVTSRPMPSRAEATVPDPVSPLHAPVEPAHPPEPEPPGHPEEPPRVDWTEDVLPPLPAEEDTSAWTSVPEAVQPLTLAGPSAEVTRVAGVDDVTDTLSRLAELRDEGVISAEDYAAKKVELLDRL